MANWYQQTKAGPLGQALMALRPQLASAAQAIYNQWDQDADGIDVELGGGGICDQVSDAMASVIHTIPDVDVTEGGQQGDDHAYLIAYNETEAYEVDIPPSVYETGGGYNWKKIPNVLIDAGDVIVHPINRADIGFE